MTTKTPQMKSIEELKNKIIEGDCMEVLKEIPDNSIDTIITDPPYGLEFVGKDWDKFGVSKGRAKRLLGADNEGTGDKFFDYREGASKSGRYSELTIKEKSAFQEFNYNWAKEALRVAKPGATLLCFGGTRTWHRLACALEDAGWIIKDTIMWIYGSGFPKSYNIPKGIDAKLRIGKCNPKGINKSELCKKTGKKVIRLQPNNGILGEKKEVLKKENTELITPEAKFWNGYGTALKPAYEPIIMAMKPNEGSYAENALKWGVAGLNINGGKIGINQIKAHHAPKGTFAGGEERKSDTNYYNNLGRFPANLILDEEAAQELDRQSGNKCGQLAPTTGNEPSTLKRGNVYGDYSGYGKVSQPKDKLGGASRFFYVAKASRAERNAGCEGWYEIDNSDKYNDKFPCSKADRFKNNHPTVKPIKLMEYLCILTKTPTGGIILDPFVGSGTTCIAAIKTGRDFIGIEKEPEYVRIAEARINYWKQKNEEQNKQQTLL